MDDVNVHAGVFPSSGVRGGAAVQGVRHEHDQGSHSALGGRPGLSGQDLHEQVSDARRDPPQSLTLTHCFPTQPRSCQGGSDSLAFKRSSQIVTVFFLLYIYLSDVAFLTFTVGVIVPVL